jgi:endonuclease/exonuclease/phosphatase family metal-dependent hydrolase
LTGPDGVSSFGTGNDKYGLIPQMKSIEIDFSTYPDDAIVKRGKLSASCGEWVEAVTALLAADHELRVSFNDKKSGSLRVFFNIDKGKKEKNGAVIYSATGDNAELRVTAENRGRLASFIMQLVRKRRPLRVLTWNVGTAAVLEESVKSTALRFSVALSYPENPHFHDIVNPAKERYDIICLQEVLTEEHVLKKGGKCVWVGTFDDPAWIKYKCYVSLRGNNALITLVHRDLCGASASLSRTDLVFEKVPVAGGASATRPEPGPEEPDQRQIYYPFAQKIPVLGVNLFNVHLTAGPAAANVRKKQLLELLAHCGSSHGIVGGDFNTGFSALPFEFKSKFSCKTAASHTYEYPCDPSSKTRHTHTYDYIGLWGSPKLAPPSNTAIAVPRWGFGSAHRHFPVEAEVVFGA